ncbi:DNA/RNA nuclease SfsA [uncultured Tolumonas sp.]|uniref:DNA/RNA nuclease SfsA n=1 Tax=uncultured Tolumonas sp. TaxID=263765 RepID=UPI00292EED9A|nr:DNA/RNA nuclease SfsA [uncultured Tolumonas sp.]
MVSRTGLIPGRILQRYKRFLADVALEDGSVVTAHCTNTGTMRSCWAPGDLTLLEPAANPDRKLKYTWLACRREKAWVGVDTGIPNKVVAEAARLDRLPGLAGLHDVRTEVRYGAESSRIDVLARDGEGRLVYLEVKNSTLNLDGTACFPDAVTSRGTKHLRELQGMVAEGHRAAVVFFLNRDDVRAFDAAREIDPDYAAELDRAAQNGVMVLPVGVRLEAESEKNGTWSLEWHLTGLLPWLKRA